MVGNLFLYLVVGCMAAFVFVIGSLSVEDALRHKEPGDRRES
ncbi:hypothetical protein U1769_02815 [Sphingomonas sp. ZT3P38]